MSEVLRHRITGWSQARLMDLCDAVDYGYTASASSMPEGPRFLRITDIVPGFVNWNKVPFCKISQSGLERYRLVDGDIVVARTGATTGVSAYISDPPDAVFASYLVRLKINKAADARFVYYFLKSPSFWTYMGGVLGDKSAQPNASAATITQARIAFPALSEQRAIAAVLACLDEKIDLNRRANQTLGAIACAIFKSWFVDFDPMREGHPLFPPTLQTSRLGLIPAGWRVDSLLEQADLLSGGTPKTSEPEYWGGEIPWASAGDVSQCSEVFLVETQRAITRRGLEESATQIIPSWSTVVIARGATTGRHVMFGEPMAMNQTCYALRSKFGADLALYCQTGNIIGELVHASHGSVFDTITTRTFHAHAAVLPDRDVLIAFDRKVRPFFELILCNQKESLTLAALRDALLPKLLSGEIRVKQAEKIVGEVM
jgi:type I restriction enzyme S subunit